MEKIKFEDYSFSYPKEEKSAIKNLSLSIEEGEFVLVVGPSGSGKTTLLQQLKREIRPEGKKKGNIFYDDEDIFSMDDLVAVEEIGMVFQDVESQIVTDKVYRELVFAMENLGWPVDKMKKRVGEMSSYFGLEKLLYESVDELSGGQKQILNLASVLVLQPKVLLLDEPTSQLDPVSTKEFLQIIERLNKEFSITVIMSEHRLEEIFPMADKIILMDEGEIVYNGTPKEVSRQIYINKDEKFFIYLPSVVRLYFELDDTKKESSIPITVREGKDWIKDIEVRKVIQEEEYKYKEKLIKLRDVSFKYRREKPYILRKLNLEIYEGEKLSILGGNGGGKSTLLRVMAGIMKPQYGQIYYQGKKLYKMKEEERFSTIGYLAQNPMVYFTHDSVRDELFCRGRRLDLNEDEIFKLIKTFSMEDILSRHPYDISGGEKQLLALATVIMAKPDFLLLDEPTKGLDPMFKEVIKELINIFSNSGTTIVMATHDIEFAARNSDRCALLFDGDIAIVDTPRRFFSDNYFYTTTINRVVRDKSSLAIVEQDVV